MFTLCSHQTELIPQVLRRVTNKNSFPRVFRTRVTLAKITQKVMIKFISSYFCKHMYIDIHNFSYSEEMRGDF